MSEPLDGFFKGSIATKTNWLGKTFDARHHSGINVFNENGKRVEKYPFKTYVGKSLTNQDLEVLKIDYNLPTNPWYIRLIVDELVETSSGKYSGKLNIKIGPLAFALGTFRLAKP